MNYNNINVEQVARIAHETNRLYCESLGDMSQATWENAPRWQKDSAFNGVLFHLGGEHSPSESHESWLQEKEKEGWKYGPTKDPDKKEHPCFVAYDQLPIEQRMKDYLFSHIVKAFKEAVRL